MHFLSFHARPAKRSVTSCTIHFMASLIFLDSTSAFRARSHIRAKDIELIAFNVLIPARTLVPWQLAIEACISIAMSACHPCLLPFSTNIFLAAELRTPDHVVVIVNEAS